MPPTRVCVCRQTQARLRASTFVAGVTLAAAVAGGLAGSALLCDYSGVVVLLIVGACFDAAYAIGAARIANWMRTHPLAQTLQRWTFSAALIGFALRLSFD